MRYPLKYSVLGLLALLAFSSVLGAQEPQNQNQPRKANEATGGPAPVHDLNGTWLGPGEPVLNNRIPPMTAEGQAKLKLNIPDPFSASSNDPWKTCDPFGMPRSVNNQTGQLGFATMPGRIIIMSGFNRTWREVWMDGRKPPKNIGHEGAPSGMCNSLSIGP